MVILILLLLCLPVLRPLINQGFFTMHDYQQVARLFELNKSLLAGQFPVRWVQDLGFGFGYALFNFYPPLVYYLGEIFHLAGASFIDSTKIIWGIALVGSAVTMYLLAKELFGKISAIVAAIFYLYAPYHALDAYVRGALAELFSFVWLPLILLFSYKTVKTGKTHYAIITGIFLALLMVTHNLIFLPFFPLVLLWCLGLWLVSGRRNFRLFTAHCSLFTVLAFALTAFFWLPSLAEKQFTLVDQFLTTNLASYKIHFVCLSQLWNSPWGFGGSVAGCTDGISFMLGKLYFLAIVLSPLIVFLLLRSKKYLLSGLVLVALGLFLFSLFMTTDYSGFLWDHLSPLWYLQFPWRFLEFAAVFSSLLAGAVFTVIRDIKLRIILAALVIASVIFIEAKYFQPQFYLSSQEAAQLTSDQEIKWQVSASSFEYMSRGLTVHPTVEGGYLPLGITENNLGAPGFIRESGDFMANSFSFLPTRVNLSGSSQRGVTLIFPIANFPGWRASLDGQPWSITDSNLWKLVTILFPKGSHNLEIEFVNTPVRNLGNIVSLLALLSLPALFYGARRSKK